MGETVKSNKTPDPKSHHVHKASERNQIQLKAAFKAFNLLAVMAVFTYRLESEHFPLVSSLPASTLTT
jgi:hypothetical protein